MPKGLNCLISMQLIMHQKPSFSLQPWYFLVINSQVHTFGRTTAPNTPKLVKNSSWWTQDWLTPSQVSGEPLQKEISQPFGYFWALIAKGRSTPTKSRRFVSTAQVPGHRCWRSWSNDAFVEQAKTTSLQFMNIPLAVICKKCVSHDWESSSAAQVN